MVTVETHHEDIVLYYPTESLTDQAVRWIREHPHYHLRLVSSRRPASIWEALGDAAIAVIDATEQVDAAMNALEQLAGTARLLHLAVYSERMHEGLELFVRLRGAMLLLGPMEPNRWDGFFEPVQWSRASSRASATGGLLAGPPAENVGR